MKDFIDLTVTGGEAGREDTQGCWQGWVANTLHNCTILDVGAGLCKSKERMEINGNKITTQDLGPGLPVDIAVDLPDIPNASFDVVTCFDVIEHVPHYREFSKELCRIAKQSIFVTTPNIMHTKGTHVYHFHEFLPSELLELFGGRNEFKSGWMMVPELGIIPVPVEDFIKDRYCYNFCLHVGATECFSPSK